MKNKWKLLAICVALPLLVGGVSALLTRGSMEQFGALQQPPLAPPGWLFPVVWTILYIAMGVASYLFLIHMPTQKNLPKGLTFYGLQLIFNFFWSIFFFNLELYWFSFVWLLVLWALIIATTVEFSKVSKAARWLLVPYIIWVTFAAYLNAGIAVLN